MNPKGTFFQTTFDGEPAPIELAGFRGRVTAPCPGRTDNTVSLCLGEGCNKFKLSRPKNVGSCEATSFSMTSRERSSVVTSSSPETKAMESIQRATPLT